MSKYIGCCKSFNRCRQPIDLSYDVSYLVPLEWINNNGMRWSCKWVKQRYSQMGVSGFPPSREEIINFERQHNKPQKTQLNLEVDNREISNPREVAEHFNHSFTNIADKTLANNTYHIKIANNIQVQPMKSRVKHLPDTDIEEIQSTSIIKSFKPKTSPGVDGVSSKLLQQCCETLTPTGVVPNLAVPE
ncbi:hypothetical protein J6590_018107 [Homalodisca vitripennis]|nr:hypothetical protein J6590_018107 [Homalodisca vitripennis]